MKRLAFAIAWATPAVAAAHAEPDAMGPLAVETNSYDFGDEAFSPFMLNGDVELRAEVYSPTAVAEGPFPLVMVLHGRHGTCYNPDTPMGVPGDGSFNGAFQNWPCAANHEAIPSHEGYAFLGELLASHGMIVVSISANGVNAVDNGSDDGGALARADLLNEHYVLWEGWNAGDDAPFDGKFIGAVDFEHVGVVGHSRGGEGVATWAVLDQEAGEPHVIDAALLLAPVDFERRVLPNVALGVVLPYCDGDVFDLQGVRYFDDARYAQADDQAPKYAITLEGGNHNFFNTIWSPSEFVAGAGDDWAFMEDSFGVDLECAVGAATRLTESEQRAALGAYAAAFFRMHLLGEIEWSDVLRGDVVPESAEAARPNVAYLGPAGADARLDINHVDTEASLATNELGGAVSSADAPAYFLCGLADSFDFPESYDHCLDEPGFMFGGYFDGRQPHTPGLGQLRIGMSDGGSWTNALPEGTDASGLTHLQFRAAVDYESPLHPGGTVDLTVELVDGGGASDAVTVPLDTRGGELAPVLPRKLLRGVRVPLASFDVDLADLAEVTLRMEGSGAGLLISDLAFTDPVPVAGTTGTGGDSSGPGGGTAESGDLETGEPTPPGSSSGTGEATGTGDDGTSGPASAGSDSGCGCRHRSRGAPGLAVLLLLTVVSLRRRP